MWMYVSVLLNGLLKKFIKISVVASVFIVVITLFISWGFKSQNQTQSSSSEILKTNRDRLYQVFQQSEYQTKQGKQMAAMEKRVYCSVFGALCSNNPQDQEKDFPRSLFGFVSTVVTTPLLHPPASGIAYIQNSLRDAGFFPKTYASEGLGFESLRPFLDVWKAFRNAVYLVLVIIIIAIGFMIMFQFKIDAHTVISIENALPRIVIALLVITFSYAIAGLLIDLTYMIILLVFQIFESTGLKGYDSQSLQTHYLTSNILGMGIFGQDGALYAGRNAAGIYAHTLMEVFRLIPFQVQILLGTLLSLLSFYLGLRLASGSSTFFNALLGHFELSSIVISAKPGDIIGTILSLVFGAAFGTVLVFGGLLILLVVGLLFLYARVVFLLIGAYVKIIIQLIFAPIFLVGEAIPGRNSFTGWLKTLFGHLMTFPIVITLLLVVQVVQTYGFGAGVKGSFSLPLLYGFDTSTLAFIISGAMLFAIPDITKDTVKKITGEEGGIKAGPGLLFGGAAILAGTAMGSIGQLESLHRLTHNRKADPMLGGVLNKAKGLLGLGKPSTPPTGGTGHGAGGGGRAGGGHGDRREM